MSKLGRYLREPERFVVAFDQHVCSIVPDGLYLKSIYKILNGNKLDLEHPKKYSEKLQWLKLHDKNPKYPYMTDKYEARRLAAEKIGEEHLVPLAAVYDSADEIDFDSLPDRFVLKCSHDSGSAQVVTDKKAADPDEIRENLRQALSRSFWRKGRETAYDSGGKIKPKILCEKYLYGDRPAAEFPDFKFFCFDGKVKFFQMNIGRGTPEGVKVTFYDPAGNRLDIQEAAGYPSGDNGAGLPAQIGEMIELAEKLAECLPHIRIDFMFDGEKIYFSEYTFYHCGGFFDFKPDEWNERIGEWITVI